MKKVLKVAGVMLLGLAVVIPASWGDDSIAQTNEQAAGSETGNSPAVNADSGKDPDDEPVTVTDLNGLRTELETLRDQFQNNFDKNTATTSRALKFGGTATTKFSGSDDTTAKTGFSVPSISLKFTGSLLKDYKEGQNVDYVFGVNTGGTDLTLRAQDAYLSYSILPSNDVTKPYLYVFVGQQKKIFGLEATASEEYKPTINGAQFTKSLSLDARDIGVVLTGDLFPHLDYGFNKYRVPLINYSLGVVNGSGFNVADDNDAKDVFARVAFNAPVDYNDFLRGLTLGVSGYWGIKTATATSTATTVKNVAPSTGTTAIPITTKTSTATLSQKGDKNRYGADISYVNTPIGFTLEYVRGEDLTISSQTALNGITTTPSTSTTIKSEGYTATVFYNFGEQFQKSYKDQTRIDDWYPVTYQPFLRFDRYDPNLDVAGDATDIWTVGFNWFFAATTKLQLNWNIKTGESTTPAVNEYLAQFQYGF
jgi:phosphate-selective porin